MIYVRSKASVNQQKNRAVTWNLAQAYWGNLQVQPSIKQEESVPNVWVLRWPHYPGSWNVWFGKSRAGAPGPPLARQVFLTKMLLGDEAAGDESIRWITMNWAMNGRFIEKILIYSTPTRLTSFTHQNSNGPHETWKSPWTGQYDETIDPRYDPDFCCCFFFETSHAAGFGFCSGETRDFSHGRCLCGKQLS